MCNRCNCGCGSYNQFANSSRERCGCRQNRRGCENAWLEAEEIMMEQQRRRCREDRCAREFVRCMQCHREY